MLVIVSIISTQRRFGGIENVGDVTITNWQSVLSCNHDHG